MNIYITVIGLVVIIIGLIAYILQLRRFSLNTLSAMERFCDINADCRQIIEQGKDIEQKYERLVLNTATLKQDYFDLSEMYRKAFNKDKTIMPNHAEIYNSINRLRTIVDKSIYGILRKVDCIYVRVAQNRGYDDITHTKEQILVDIPIPELSTILVNTPVILSAITKKLDELTKRIAVKEKDIEWVLTYSAGEL